jgi:hypothetical protein
MVELRFRLQREGELATGKRVLRFYRSWESVSQVCMAFMDEGGGTGLAAQVYRVPLADLLAQGEWVVVGVDDNPPRKTRAIYLALGDSGIHTFNITQGSGGDGEGGVPAAVDARVRVDEVPASREVLVVEKPADGQWRVAGYGPTPGGVGAIDLRVVGGVVYAMAVDDYGVQFVADLAVQVGQRIRPKQYSGWVYEITEAGQLPSTEPEWWAAVGENPSRPLGTARAVARRYFQPIAHGPVPVEVI